MPGEDAPGSAAPTRSHHPQRPVRRRPTGRRRYLHVGREGSCVCSSINVGHFSENDTFFRSLIVTFCP